tara:strand:+ start:4805 stop:5029 length:225 start_codon:yes stop_codon:yes gene_type:complete
MISTLCNSLPRGSFLCFAKHYRENSNKVKFSANFSCCANANAIQDWLKSLSDYTFLTVEYSRIREKEATIIVSF